MDSSPVCAIEDSASNPQINNQDFWLEKLYIVLFTEIGKAGSLFREKSELKFDYVKSEIL